jgi:hypothetical protein
MLRVFVTLFISLVFCGLSPAFAAGKDEARPYRAAFITYAKATGIFNAIVKAELSRIGYREGEDERHRAIMAHSQACLRFREQQREIVVS